MPRSMVVRTLVGVGVAVAALVIAFVAGTGSVATAVQGQPIVAGSDNTETNETIVRSTAAGTPICGAIPANGLVACGQTGLEGLGSQQGVFAQGGLYGVSAKGTGSGTGVLGTGLVGVKGESFGNGDGVDGTVNNSCCSAVYGLNNGTGNGVAGRADTGTGVLAASTNGIGLKVDGKAQFSRSGVATVSAGQTYKQVSLTGLTSATFVVATVQGNTAGVWVQRVAVTPASGYFRIYLNKAAVASTKVGWFAIN